MAVKIEEAEKRAASAGDEISQRLLTVLAKATDFASKGLLSETIAREFMDEIYEVGSAQPLKHYSVRKWGDDWLESVKRTVKKPTHELYGRAIRELCAWLGDGADGRLEMLSVAELEAFRNYLHDEGRTASTANNYLKWISICLNTAVKRGVLLKNPCKAIERLPQVDSVERKPFSMEEVSRLLAAADDQWRLAVLVGLYSGLRISDIANLSVGDSDLERAVLSVEPIKQPIKRVRKLVLKIPIHRFLLAEISAYLGKRSFDSADYLLPDLAGKPTSGSNGLSTTFGGVMEKAGVDPEYVRIKEEGKKGRSVAAKGFHSIRHTFVSLLADRGVNRDLRKKLVGHTDDEIHELYTHVNNARLREAIEGIPSAL